MKNIEQKFKIAANEVQRLSERPDNETLLQLYALYKQATDGDISGKRPGFTDFVGRAKYDAWSKLYGTSRDKAMKLYVELVSKLIN